MGLALVLLVGGGSGGTGRGMKRQILVTGSVRE